MPSIAPITPPVYAKSRGVKNDKVLYWIKTGELAAINFARNPGGRPSWKIFPEAIADFERRRASKPPPKQPPRQKKKTEIPRYV